MFIVRLAIGTSMYIYIYISGSYLKIFILVMELPILLKIPRIIYDNLTRGTNK